MTRRPGQSLPASGTYPGLTARDLSNGREIVVIGSGPEAEAAIEAKLREMGERDA